MRTNINTILFALMVACLLIALHQSMTYGFAQSYWLFMLTFLIMMIYQIRANKLKSDKTNPTSSTKPAVASKAKKPTPKNNG